MDLIDLTICNKFETEKIKTEQTFFTCIRWQVEVKNGNDGDEDTGQDDVKHVIHGLPLDDQVEGDVFIQVLSHILPRNLVTNVPFSTLWDERPEKQNLACFRVQLDTW